MTPARRAAAAIVPVAFATALAGCGAGSDGGAAGSGGMMGDGQGHMQSMTAPRTTGSTVAPAGEDGRSLFRASGCGGCHTLAAAGSTGTGGPNLDGARPGYAHVVQVVTEGSGSMPAFAGTLSDAQIRAVARFVANAAG